MPEEGTGGETRKRQRGAVTKLVRVTEEPEVTMGDGDANDNMRGGWSKGGAGGG